LDDRDLRSVKLSELRRNIAMVGQDVVLFDDSISANIAYGDKEGTSQEKIVMAAKTAHAEDFINSLPSGYETMIGEGGVRLSGGQRQRIAIARALLKDAPVLILDEATSALDSESERYVQLALESLMQGRTTLVIAHRLSTVERADKIVVLENGQIVEQGTHRELLSIDGYYSKLYKLQFEKDLSA
ncbi:MAG: ATP-binding cassette domain-containing protein, partial [Actinobacteria bacterium]|nr:ATP-binding cassette domain-containing protein [Actinomycetota bacterium]